MFVGCCILAVSACDESTKPEEPPPLPDPTFDQVGLPENYATQFRPFYVFDRPALTATGSPQVRVVYANDVAVAGPPPFAHGSILVMETYSVVRDAQGVPILGADGRYQRGATPPNIFVARKEKWFGRRYGANQTGDWEYASYRPDKTANQVGDAAVACAICHLDAGSSRDWIFRANIPFSGASGAIPQSLPGQRPEQPVILNYTFVPGTTTVPVGTTITWRNDDQVKHTVTATGAFDSGVMAQGASFPHTFSAVGTFDYICALHPAMKGSVSVIAQP
jgi:hypothetical protein